MCPPHPTTHPPIAQKEESLRKLWSRQETLSPPLLPFFPRLFCWLKFASYSSYDDTATQQEKKRRRRARRQQLYWPKELVYYLVLYLPLIPSLCLGCDSLSLWQKLPSSSSFVLARASYTVVLIWWHTFCCLDGPVTEDHFGTTARVQHKSKALHFSRKHLETLK